jgi:hypothetical protein
MSATSSAERAGILVAVISGGRPLLKQRPTSKFLGELRAAGVQDCVWVVNERHAGSYEQDENPIVTFSDVWAYDYAREHWTYPVRPPEPGGFFGAFPGREAACREAERRGCWGVLQLDDNIRQLYFLRNTRGGALVVRDRGGFGWYLDLLAGVVLATNARMVAPSLGSIGEAEYRVARTGFPYSAFVEQVGHGREEWFGPYEDDILHALQYADRADGATTALLTLPRYQKLSNVETGRGTRDLSGMRGQYTHDRARMLQRLQPQAAKVQVRRTTSNGRGEPRVFHQMPAGALRNPLVVTDRERYDRVTDSLVDASQAFEGAERIGNRAKAAERLASFERRHP